MAFLGHYFTRKPTPLTDFPQILPQSETVIPELTDASVFRSDQKIEGFDATDNNNYWHGGELKHVYRSRLGFKKESCPICCNATSQKYISLVYASDLGTRQSLSPCAWICEPCSCVVLDESICAQSAHWKGYSYFVPVGFSNVNDFFNSNKNDMNLFSTYEGKTPVFVIDKEIDSITDVLYQDEVNTSTCYSPDDAFGTAKNLALEEKKRQKRKAEKLARKKQRH